MRVAFVGLVMLGCAAPPAASDPGAPALLEGEPSPPPSVRAELVAIGPTVEGPPGADARPRTRVGFRTAEGVRPVDREAMTFVPRWRSGAALVDPEGRLYEVTPGGMRRMLVAHAVGPLAVSEDAVVARRE